MASATGVPERPLAGEEEPLLGGPGDASQREGRPLYNNFVLGTAVLAQAGIWILTAVIWGAVFSADLIFFSAHPLLNSVGILLLAQGILVLQPTVTPTQKRNGTYAHGSINFLSILPLAAGLTVIEINKIGHGGTHFESPHAILGIITYVLILVQTQVGFAQYFMPQLFGSVDNAKAVYKYHRISGYVIFTLALATIAAATQTDFNKSVLHIKLWAVLVTAVITLLGIIPRIKKHKLGFW